MASDSGVSDASEASALLTFRAENVRSFWHPVEFSLLATSLAEANVPRFVSWRREGRQIAVLPGAGIFGANGSGKTNALRIMSDMRAHVLYSFRGLSPDGGTERQPFLLDNEGRRNPSRFEVEITLEGVRHDYGFVVDDDRVLEEWAYRYPRGRAAMLFHRSADGIEFGPTERSTSRAVRKLLRPNALFLSTAASANHPALVGLYSWFGANMRIAEAASRQVRQVQTTELLDDDVTRDRVLSLLRAADLGVVGAATQPIDPVMQDRMRRAVRILSGQEGEPESGEEGPPFDELGVRLVHRGAIGDVELDAHDESLGTLVWFGLVGPVIEALQDGTVLLADELDASLHPALVAQLVRLFQNPRSNPHQAQLIFNSHDVTVLGDSVGERLLGRDQIWFTEKQVDGSTRLYPLTDLDPRKEEAIGRRYLAGRYGGTPILSRHEFDAAAELITSGPDSS